MIENVFSQLLAFNAETQLTTDTMLKTSFVQVTSARHCNTFWLAKARNLLFLPLGTCKVVYIHSTTRQRLGHTQPCSTSNFYSIKLLRLLNCMLPVQCAQRGGVAVSHA